MKLGRGLEGLCLYSTGGAYTYRQEYEEEEEDYHQ